MKMQVRIALISAIVALGVSWVVLRLHNDALAEQVAQLQATSASPQARPAVAPTEPTPAPASSDEVKP